MANPLIRKVPKMTGNTTGGHKSAGILDDHAIRKNIATKEGTIEKVPVNDSDIANKKYVDDNTFPKYTDAEAVTAVANADDYVKNTGDTMTGDLSSNSWIKFTDANKGIWANNYYGLTGAGMHTYILPNDYEIANGATSLFYITNDGFKGNSNADSKRITKFSDTITDSDTIGVTAGAVVDYVDNNIDDGTSAGQMAFWNGTKWVKTETSELFWDDTNNRVGIGTPTPSELLELGTGNLKMAGTFKNYPTANSPQGFIIDNTATGYTGVDYVDVFQQKFKYNKVADTTPGKFSGILNELDNYCLLTGTPGRGLTSSTYGINNKIRLYADHDQLPMCGAMSEEVIGITNTIDSPSATKREITESFNSEWVASDNYVYDKSIYNKVGGVFNTKLYGQKTYVSNYMVEIPNGIMNSELYGIYSTVTSKPDANSNVITYGIYINSTGGDTSYGVYSLAGINYFKDKVGIGTNTPATSSALDITSTTGALILPRMTTAQKNALTAVNGMLLYDTTLNQTQTYENGAWRQI